LPAAGAAFSVSAPSSALRIESIFS
jgi:hypothetical protein